MKKKVTSKDCVRCGLCCVAPHDQDAFCDVTAADMKRLGKRFVQLHVLQASPFDSLLAHMDGRYHPEGAIKTKWRKQKTGPFKGYEFCACVALRGSVLSQVSCSVYEKRPSVCRKAVKPNDRMCLELRREALNDLKNDLEADAEYQRNKPVMQKGKKKR